MSEVIGVVEIPGGPGTGAAKIDFTVESILAAHVISNIRRFDSTYVDSILHGAKAM